MAGQADGSIIIDTELDSKGFVAGSAQLLKAVSSLTTKIRNLGPTLQKALGGNGNAFSTFSAKAASLKNEVSEIESKMRILGESTIPTEDYSQLCSEIDKVSQKLDQLTQKRDKMLALGVNEDSRPYQGLLYDLTELEAKYLRLTALKAQMEQTGAAYQSGSQTVEYQQLSAALSEAKGKLSELQAEAEKSNHSLRTLFSNFAAGVKSTIGTAITKLNAGLKSAVSNMSRLVTQSKLMKKPLESMSFLLRRIAPSLLMTEGLFGLLRKAVNAFLQENEQLAANLSACWSGIGNILGPIIERLIGLVSTAIAYVTAFLSLLGIVGKSTTKAISSAGGGAKKETDKLKRQLASFDELTILQNKDEDTDGGGSGGSNLGTEQPEVTLPDWVKLFADSLKAGKWAEAATILTDQLNHMVDSVDWAGIGDKIAYWTDATLEFLATAIENFDWFNLGASLGQMINSIITGVDWRNLGVVLGAKFKILIEGLGGLFATIEWGALGTALSDCFNGLWNSIDWAQAGRTVSDGIIGVTNALTVAIQGINWQQVGNDVATMVGAINWSGVFTAISKGIGAALGGLGEALWAAIKDEWNAAVDKWLKDSERCGGDVVAGLLLGILEAIMDVGSWIYDNIFAPFIAGFESAFQIGSPSKVMQREGGYVVDGLLLGMKETWGSFARWIDEALSDILSSISTWASDAKQSISDWAARSKTDITSWVSTTKTSISNWASNTYTTISSKISSIKNTVSTGFNNVKQNIVTSLQSAMSTVRGLDWYSVGSNICSGIGNGISAGWSWLRSKVSSLAQNLLSAAKSALGIHSPSRLFRDAVGLNIGYGIGEGVEASQGSIIRTVAGVADAIAGEFNSGQYSIGGFDLGIDGKILQGLDKFSDKIAGSFADLTDRMQAIANSTSFITPRAAMGTVVPYQAQAIPYGMGHIGGMSDENTCAIVNAITAELIPAILAGLEAVISEQQSTREMLSEIEIGDTVIGQAANRYNRRMAVVNGGPIF